MNPGPNQKECVEALLAAKGDPMVNRSHFLEIGFFHDYGCSLSFRLLAKSFYAFMRNVAQKRKSKHRVNLCYVNLSEILLNLQSKFRSGDLNP